MHLELYMPRYRMEKLIPGGLQYPLKRIDDIEELDKIIFDKHCTAMTRERADNNPNLASIGVKAILIDMNADTNVWLVDEVYSKDGKAKVSIPGGHMEMCDDCETVEELLRWNLIREMYEEMTEYKDGVMDGVMHYDIAAHLKSIGCLYAEERDDWYYQYTSKYLCIFKVIYIAPRRSMVERQLVPFSLKDYKELQMIRKYNPQHFQRLIRNNMNIGHELTSDIRTATSSRYAKMMPAVMHLVENLSGNSDIHYNQV